MKLIVSDTEGNLEKILWVANQLSLIESRYVGDGNITSSIASVKPHTTLNRWWTNYDDMYPHLGTIGKPIADLLTGVTLSGEPNMHTDVFQIIEVANLIDEGYLPEEITN